MVPGQARHVVMAPTGWAETLKTTIRAEREEKKRKCTYRLQTDARGIVLGLHVAENLLVPVRVDKLGGDRDGAVVGCLAAHAEEGVAGCGLLPHLLVCPAQGGLTWLRLLYRVSFEE